MLPEIERHEFRILLERTGELEELGREDVEPATIRSDASLCEGLHEGKVGSNEGIYIYIYIYRA
jgi:hypothetical protein